MSTIQQKDEAALLTNSGVPATTPVWQHQHILDVDDFTPGEIELVISTTDAMKEVLSRPIKKVPIPSNRL